MFVSSHESELSLRRSRRISLGDNSLEGRQLLSGLAQDVQELVHDLGAIHSGSSVTKAEVKAVSADLISIARIATKPSPTSVAALEAEIKIIAGQKSITPVQAATLKKDVTAVLVSAQIPTSLAEQTAADIKELIASSGITQAQAKTIAADIKAIVADLGKLKS